ncbi:MAG: alpha-amylase family glycosyl hydrolase [Deltaproteobacteria bacterium]
MRTRLASRRLALHAALAAASLALSVPHTSHATGPHRSFAQLPTGNGYGLALYDAATARLTTFTEHPYAQRSPSEQTRDLAYDAYFGVRASGGSAWLGEVPVDDVYYEGQSHVVHASQSYGPLRAETYTFAPWNLEAPAVVLVLHVTNTAQHALTDAGAYALMNFHLGSGADPGTAGEHIAWDAAARAYTETGPSGLTVSYVPIGDPAHHGATPSNPYLIGRAGGSLVDVSDSGSAGDAVAGFQWTWPSLAAGADAGVGVVITLASPTRARTFLATRDAATVLRDEITAWDAWRTPPPAGLSAAETRVWRQSETVLRMAQVREPAPARGQILAALPPGIWWISWVRDMSYAIVALARSGHTAEANAAVDFFAHSPVGMYRAEVGQDYHVSVVRYYGDGTEWSDVNGDGPNVEFDGFGLATWAAHSVGRTDLDNNATTLAALIDSTGLIAPDSSIWEVHWNGQQKHFAYTSITGAQGLCLAGDAANAQRVRDAMVRQMVLPTGGLAGNLEELMRGMPARDAAAVEIIDFGMIDPHGALARDTLLDFEQLRTPVGRGFARNDDGGGYDAQEWVFIDLRIAEAMRRAGRTDDAAELLAWVTAQADANYGLHAELYQRDNADYVGSIPMVGFGAGAYMISLLDRVSSAVPDTNCFPGADAGVIPTTDSGASDSGESDTGTIPAHDAGTDAAVADSGGGGRTGGCSTRPGPMTSRGTWLWALAMIAGVLARRRRDPHPAARRRDPPPNWGRVRQEDCDSPRSPHTRSAGWPAAPTPSPNLGEGRAASARGGGLLLAAALVAACGPQRPGDGGDGFSVDVNYVTDGGDARVDSVVPTDALVDAHPSVLGPPVRDCSSRFVYPLGHQAGNVVAAGEWNRFDVASGAPLTDGLFSNVYRGSVTLPHGSYGYKFVADGTWAFDPTNGLTAYASGVENSRLIVPDCAAPLLRVAHWNVSTTRTVTVDVDYLDGAGRAGMDAASVAVEMNRSPIAAGAITSDASTGHIRVQLTVPENNKYTFRIHARDLAGHDAQELIVPMWVEDEPYHWGDGPMYFTFTDRFRDGNPANNAPIGGVDVRANYQGGDLSGILAALHDGYFDQLGVRALWLSPVNDNTNTAGLGTGGHQYSAYHGYWVSQPRAVEEHWGSLDDLRAVTAEAHRRGIRVLFDVANNQLHRDHPYYAAHRDWFNGDGTCVCGGTNCDWDVHALDCWFTSYLPDVNWTNMATVDQMIDDALWWLVEADADGFRVDAVKHMQHIASTTLRYRIHDTLETGNAQYYLVGETFTGADGRGLVQSFVSDRELWGQFDFPMFWSIRGAFAQNLGTMGDLDTAVGASAAAYGNAIMSPFLGNHDVERFLSLAAGQLTGGDQPWTSPPTPPTTDAPYDQLFLAFTFLLTQPGVPLIYYGDEIGLPGAGDPDNRRLMRFGASLSAREQHLLSRVQIVSHARGNHPGLRRGARRTLFTDSDGYVYSRGADADLAIVAINRGTTARTVRVIVPPELASDGTTLTDLLGGPPVTVAGGGFDMPFTPRNAALYVR